MLTCCQFATEDEIQDDPESYDCTTCPYLVERAKIGLADETALALHRQLSGRAVQDLHLTDLVFRLARLQMGPQEAEQLVDRLELIHEFANPPDAASTPAEEPE